MERSNPTAYGPILIGDLNKGHVWGTSVHTNKKDAGGACDSRSDGVQYR